MAWQVRPDGIRVDGGGTGGFSAAILVDPGRGRAVARLLLDGRTADVHALGSATFQSHVPAGRVERAWRSRTLDLGPAGEVTVRCHGASGNVVADVTIAFGADAVALRIAFEPSGEMSGLRILPRREQPAPPPG